MAGFCVQFFSIFDALDGIRARRTKCGSPCGRIIDEAGDTMVYAMFAHIAAYLLRVPPGWLTLGYALINIPQYAMEVNFTISGVLVNCDEYFGAMETELMVFSIFFFGGLLGTDGINKPLGVSFIPDSIHLIHILLSVFFCLQMHFLFDNMSNCMKIDKVKALKYGGIPFFTLALAIFHASFSPESFNN